MDYKEFLNSKEKSIISSGFDVLDSDLNDKLDHFQRYIVKIALKKGRFAIFADCGLGKTFMQLEWAYQVGKYAKGKVLVLTQLSVVSQTKKEATKFNIDTTNIDITNYEQIKNIDLSKYIGVVLDESSILKGKDGKLSRLLIESFKGFEYKLPCTATPSPNDHIELGQTVEFLGYDTYNNMKAMFFVNDTKIKASNKWRLKKHATDNFWKYVCTWSISVDNPSTLGFDGSKYILPTIQYYEHLIPVENNTNTLFASVAVSATDIHKDLKRTLEKRIKKAKELVNNSNEQWIVWTLNNYEAKELEKVLNDSVNVHGSQKAELKNKHLNDFKDGKFKVLITKLSIAGFGMNFQNARNQLFCSYDFKFEPFFQGVRREYRFGQEKEVNVHLLVPQSQLNVRSTILEKQYKHYQKIKEMAKYSANTDYKKKIMATSELEETVRNNDFTLINDDCNSAIKNIDSNSIDYSFFSPPFSDLYTYSDDPKDFSNVKNDDEFFKQFSFLAPELFRVIKPGRLMSMHIMQGTTSKGKDGFLSIKDLRGDLIRLMQSVGFYFHAEKMIRKNPQLAAVRTKNQQLMHGQTKRDSSINRPGLADYVITFRKPGKNEKPIQNNIPFDVWCKLAEPVWMDINESDVISGYRKAKGKQDEKHMTPTQLSVIENCYLLWSNPKDKVFSPFSGVGSEAVKAIQMDRYPIGIELKNSYFKENIKNCKNAVASTMQTTLL
ncbi:MAG: DNA methylase [Aureispira sp.]|nr:DNA methylase [Aureispira sp.]